MDSGLEGSFWVRVAIPAINDARSLWRRTKDRMVGRRHAIKLRYWPERYPELDRGQILDLDWCWIQAAKGLRIGELRVSERVGEHDNVRIIFYVHDSVKAGDPLPICWILAVMQKKRDQFTSAEIATIRARRQLILTRYYGL